MKNVHSMLQPAGLPLCMSLISVIDCFVLFSLFFFTVRGPLRTVVVHLAADRGLVLSLGKRCWGPD